MKVANFLIILMGIFFIGFPQVAIAKDGRVRGKPFIHLQEQIDNMQLTPVIKGPAGPQGPAGPPGPAGPEGPTGIANVYIRGISTDSFYPGTPVQLYCYAGDAAISASFFPADPASSNQVEFYDVVRPICDTGICGENQTPTGFEFVRNLKDEPAPGEGPAPGTEPAPADQAYFQVICLDY